MSADLVVAQGLSIGFETPEGPVTVVSDLDLSVQPGEATALVGESGCGKSVTARALVGLLPAPPARVEARRLEVDGVEITTAKPEALRTLRGRRVGFVFQDPMSALNPVMTLGTQITERLRWHGGPEGQGLSRRAARERAVALLAEVGIPDPEARMKAYPHQLSGGMRQRVVMAIALACDPTLLIADEPTTALDVTVQARLLDALESLRQARQMALLLITHDLGVVARSVRRVLVMYAGQIVEEAPVEDLFADPQHPYTRGLLAAVPGATGAERLRAIPGTVPSPRDFPTGCRFAPRCDQARPECVEPVPLTREGDRAVRCLFPGASA